MYPFTTLPKSSFHLFEISNNINFLNGKFIYDLSSDITALSIIQPCENNTYILGGRYGSSLPLSYRPLLIKTDSSQNLRWSKKYYHQTRFLDLRIATYNTYTNELFFVGSTYDTTGMYTDFVLAKMDTAGNAISSQSFYLHSTVTAIADIVTPAIDSGYAFLIESTNGLILTKIDKDLNLQWMKVYPNTVQAFNLIQTHDEGYAFVAIGYNDLGSLKHIFIKTDKYGNVGCGEFDTTAVAYPFPIYDSTITLYSISDGQEFPSTVTVTNSSTSIQTACFCNPKANFTFNINGYDAVFNNTSNNFSNTQWNFGDGYFSNTISPTHTYSNEGNYTVTLIIQDGNCFDTIRQNIIIKKDFSFALFPNPNNGNAILTYNLKEPALFTVYNTLGQMVNEYFLPVGNQQLNLSFPALANGVYHIRITQNKEKIFSTQMIIGR